MLLGSPIGEIWDIQLFVPPRSLLGDTTPLYNHVNTARGFFYDENMLWIRCGENDFLVYWRQLLFGFIKANHVKAT